MPSNSDLDNATNMPPELKKLLEIYSAIHTEALHVYRPLVRSVINGAITEKADIERIFDGLINFCGEPEFVELLKKAWPIYVQERTSDGCRVYSAIQGNIRF